jgi:hypothetical protein
MRVKTPGEDMTKRLRQTTISFSLAVILIAHISLAPVMADKGSDEVKPFRLYSAEMVGPIGRAFSTGQGRAALKINGRAIEGEQAVWRGQLIEAPANASAKLQFDFLGEITLAPRAKARFSVSESDNRVLIASLIDGDIKVRLEPGAATFVSAYGSTFSSSRGAAFRILTRGAGAMIETLSGSVETQQPAQRRYVVRPVGSGSSISVRARTTRQIQVRVTDENDKPVPDIPIIFALGSSGGNFAGSFSGGGTSATVRTDAQGVARTDFTSGSAAVTNTISAVVENTRFSWEGTISVTAGGFWTARNTAIIVGIAAGAAIGIAIALNDDDEELRPLPPPRVNP